MEPPPFLAQPKLGMSQPDPPRPNNPPPSGGAGPPVVHFPPPSPAGLAHRANASPAAYSSALPAGRFRPRRPRRGRRTEALGLPAAVAPRAAGRRRPGSGPHAGPSVLARPP